MMICLVELSSPPFLIAFQVSRRGYQFLHLSSTIGCSELLSFSFLLPLFSLSFPFLLWRSFSLLLRLLDIVKGGSSDGLGMEEEGDGDVHLDVVEVVVVDNDGEKEGDNDGSVAVVVEDFVASSEGMEEGEAPESIGKAEEEGEREGEGKGKREEEGEGRGIRLALLTT